MIVDLRNYKRILQHVTLCIKNTQTFISCNLEVIKFILGAYRHCLT